MAHKYPFYIVNALKAFPMRNISFAKSTNIGHMHIGEQKIKIKKCILVSAQLNNNFFLKKNIVKVMSYLNSSIYCECSFTNCLIFPSFIFYFLMMSKTRTTRSPNKRTKVHLISFKNYSKESKRETQTYAESFGQGGNTFSIQIWIKSYHIKGDLSIFILD